MNKILPLFDEQFVLEFLRREILPQYPSFSGISRVFIKPYKEFVWETTYHVVIGYNAYFVNARGEEKRISIVAVGHSNESRENVFRALKYLWSHGLAVSGVDLPRPLLYDSHFNCTFYRAISGENLLYYIKKKDLVEVEKIVISAARLFARLHALPVSAEANFNPSNGRIETVVPGVPHILQEIANRYGQKYQTRLEKVYSRLIAQEEEFFRAGLRLSLIHGDAHPENIIKTATSRIGLVDFTDFCLGDPARDLGTFMQQLEYKVVNKLGDISYAARAKELFLEEYLLAAGIKLTPAFQERIGLYYNWTMIRTAVYWFLKFDHDERRAEMLLSQAEKNLGL